MIPSADVSYAITWYVVLLAVGLPGWLLVAHRAKYLPDAGYSLGKVLGLLGIALISWVLSLGRIAPFSQPVLLGLVVLSWGALIYRRHAILPLARSHWKQILMMEIVCIILFVIGVALRSSKPQIEGIEKFMDSGILNGLLRHSKGAPLDPWYAGATLNYYYFGHWIVAVIAKLAQIPGWIAFNLGFATVVTVAGSQFVLAGWLLTKRYIGGLLVVFLALFASNIHPFLAKVRGDTSYFFFNSGRFIDYRINEYPFYSMSLGDLHAHMLGLMLTAPLAVLAILHLSIKERLALNAAMMGLLIGLMLPTNAFDTISCSIIVGLVLIFRWYRTARRPFTALWHPAGWCAVAAGVPILLFLTHFHQPTGGFGVAIFKIPLLHIAWQFGVPLGLLSVGLVYLGVSGYFGAERKPLRLVQKIDPRHAGVLLFTFFAICLIALPEFVFLKDLYFYVNPPYYLANTLFKIWYTGWVMLAIATGSVIVIAVESLWRRNRVIAVGGGAVVVGAMAILCVGISYGLKTLQDARPNTLDGITYMNRLHPDRDRVVRWAADHITGQPRVLEAVGDSYSEFNWFSSYTGLPTIMGWRSHEYGWRYSKDIWTVISSREQSAKQIYESRDAVELQMMARNEQLGYILVGPQERSVYGANDAVFSQAFGQPVFDSVTVDIYKVR